MGWPEFYVHSRETGGVVRLSAAAHAADLSPSAIRRRARQEGWWWPFHDVAATPGTVIDARARAHAAVLHAQGRTGRPEDVVAAATGWTAAYLQGIHRSAPSRPQIAIPASRARPKRRTPRAGKHRPDQFTIQTVRRKDFAASDITVVQHVPTVVPDMLVRDLASICDRARLRALVIDLIHGGRTSVESLKTSVTRWPSFAGRPKVRQVVADLEAAGRTDSPLEFVTRRRFEDVGIHLDRGQVAVPLRTGGTLHCDLGIVAIRFAIEADSMSFHSSREQLVADAERSNAMMALADTWRVMRVTWDMLAPRRFGALVETVRLAITEQSRRFLRRDWPAPEHLRS